MHLVGLSSQPNELRVPHCPDGSVEEEGGDGVGPRVLCVRASVVGHRQHRHERPRPSRRVIAGGGSRGSEGDLTGGGGVGGIESAEGEVVGGEDGDGAGDGDGERVGGVSIPTHPELVRATARSGVGRVILSVDVGRSREGRIEARSVVKVNDRTIHSQRTGEEEEQQQGGEERADEGHQDDDDAEGRKEREGQGSREGTEEQESEGEGEGEGERSVKVTVEERWVGWSVSAW